MNPMHLSSITRPKSILVATDLHDLDFMLPVAIDQARMTGAMIWLLHVIPPEAFVATKSGAYPSGHKEKAFRFAEALLNKVAFELKEKNLACAYEVRGWYPVDQTADFIRENSIKRPMIGRAKLRMGSPYAG